MAIAIFLNSNPDPYHSHTYFSHFEDTTAERRIGRARKEKNATFILNKHFLTTLPSNIFRMILTVLSLSRFELIRLPFFFSNSSNKYFVSEKKCIFFSFAIIECINQIIKKFGKKLQIKLGQTDVRVVSIEPKN